MPGRAEKKRMSINVNKSKGGNVFGLPRQCNNAAFASHATPAVASLCLYVGIGESPVLRIKSQVQKWQSAVSLSMKRTFGHFEQPLPMALDTPTS